MARSAIHPGHHLAEQLEVLSISAAELGRRLGVPTNRIAAIVNGQRAVTGDTALRLGHFFGNSPQFWLGLQALYDLRSAEQRVGREIDALPTLDTNRKTSGRRRAA
jgi:addiction module HigA family antidote